MSGNVLINALTAVHAGSNGILNTIDVCMTPIPYGSIPIPYPNVAQSRDADKTADSVLINGNPACHQKSVFSKSVGDEPGSHKGVASGQQGAEASFISASFNVMIEGTPATRAFDTMVSNKMNTPPMPLMQPPGMPPIAMPAMSEDEVEAEEGPYVAGYSVMGDVEVKPNLDVTAEETE
ncbi:DUF4150 domain-containing protein [Salinibius halmophilus]|uniref:DUF4150 domain-containing protein n=1 Tax=Salinibius halmophilus TaxID=1853216 RepID=UPI000E65FB7A|nr:DUF4150 domain-containing protein [Salinibius halmophilus]